MTPGFSISALRVLLALLLTAALASVAARAAAGKPDVLFVAFDDLNDWVLDGSHGVQAPQLQRFMARATTFANAHCAAPSCHPSRLAVMTGVRPSTSGIDRNVYQKADVSWRTGPDSGTGALAKAVLLSQHFRDHGWRALGTGKILHGLQWVDGSENEPASWDDYFPSARDQIPPQVRPEGMVEDAAQGIVGARPLGGGLGRRGQIFGAAPLHVPDAAMSDAKVVDWAIEQLRAPRGQPLFLAVGLFRPHIPWEVPEAHFDRFPLERIQRPVDRPGDLDDTHGHDRTSWHDWVLANEEKHRMWDRLVQGYLASIHFADTQFGRLMAALEASGRADNTVVVVWSDHGMHLGEKRNWEKFTLWERSTRVPLMIALPGQERGARVASPASLVDVFPTLCELLGIPIPPQCEGTSLMPQVRDPRAARSVPAITTQTQGRQSGHAVRDERWRYIRYFDGFEELYDLRNDPHEFENVAGRREHAAEQARLLSWLVRLNIPLDGKYPARR